MKYFTFFEGPVMSQEQMYQYIEDIGRCELYDELEQNRSPHAIFQKDRSLKYLKAIRASLIALGFSQEWVETEFKQALEERYLKK